MIDLLNSVEFIAAASGFHYGFRWHQELLERNEIAGDSRPNRSAADGLFRKTWPSQPDNWEMKPRNRDCKSANADSQAAITIAARQTRVVGMQSRLQRCKRQLSGCQSRLQRGKRQLSACNPDCSAANANCQPAIPIAAQQTPIVRLQSRLQRDKRQLSGCSYNR